MPSISNRISKLEQAQLEAAIARATPIAEMSDAELLETILEGEGLPSAPADVLVAVERFNKTGELPGGLHNRLSV